jgi:ABC-type nitrate/sulfonate/bicarbonate transport system substrate-binding protein
MRFKDYVILFAIIALLGMLAAGCGTPAAPPPETKVTVMIDWVPNTNHTGLYVAKDKGFYKEQGLEVEILQPAESGAAPLVASGKAQFGVSYQEEVTQARTSNNIPIVSLAAVIQHNTSALASKKELNITRPKDFEGKRYGGWGSPMEEAVIKSIIEKDGGDFSKVKFINVGTADFLTSINKDVDFYWIFQGWDGIQARLKNVPINEVVLKDIDPALDYYTPVLITTEALINDNPELVKAFMKATSQGYAYAINNPEEAAQILLANAPESNQELIVESQQWLSSKYQDDAAQWGFQKREVWERYAQWMYERNLIPSMLDVDKAFTNEFLPQN